MNNRIDNKSLEKEQKENQKKFGKDTIFKFIEDFKITFDDRSKEVSSSFLVDNYELGQIKDSSKINKTTYKQVTIPPAKNPNKAIKENLNIVLFKYYRNYYLNEVFYGQILSNNNKSWYPRKNYGNKNYLPSTARVADRGTIAEIAILRDLHNYQLTMLWNYYDFFGDSQIRSYEYLYFINDDF